MDNKDRLIKAQENYIKFLGKEIQRTAVYLHTHRMECSQEIADKGKKLRKRIEKLKEFI